jgi:hypothetical protein
LEVVVGGSSVGGFGERHESLEDGLESKFIKVWEIWERRKG